MSEIQQEHNLAVRLAASRIEKRGVPEDLELTTELTYASSQFDEMLSTIEEKVIAVTGLSRFDKDFAVRAAEVRAGLLTFGAALMVRGFNLGAQSTGSGEI